MFSKTGILSESYESWSIHKEAFENEFNTVKHNS